MTFWRDINNPEPLRQYRWYIYFGLLPNQIKDEDLIIDSHMYALKESTKPSYKIETTSHVLINHTFNFPKNVVWNPIKIKMVSVVNKKNAPLGLVFDQMLVDSGYITPDKPDKKQISKKNMSFQQVRLFQIDENENIIENWLLSNAFITNVNYGNLSYSSEEMVDIDFDLLYDYANLEPTAYIQNLKRNVNRLEEEKIQLRKTIGETDTSPRGIILGGEPSGAGVTGNIGGKQIPFSDLEQ